MRLKKGLFLILLTASLGSSTTFANNYSTHYKPQPDYKGVSQPQPITYNPHFGGFYLGASVGAINNFFTFHDTLGNIIDPGEVSPTLEGFAGYGWLINPHFYLGGEVYLNDTLGDASANTNVLDGGSGGTHVRIQTRETFGLSLLPGMIFNEDTLGYFRIGPAWTQFNTMVKSPTMENTNHNTQLGLELGVGVLTHLSRQFDLRLEYSHSFYQTYRTTVNNYHMKPPLSDRANLGLVYNFV